MLPHPTNEPQLVTTDSPIEDHFPSLYRRADSASNRMQRNYLHFYTAHLILLILGSGGSTVASMIPEGFSMWLHVGMIIILVIGIAINFIFHARKYDEKWFGCRSVAESTKTAAWRFMMKASPFEDDSTAEETFRSKVREIQTGKHAIVKTLAQELHSGAQLITSVMKDMREKHMVERKDTYLKARLLDQKVWYQKKARYNSVMESRWFYATTGLQLLAIIFALIQLVSAWGVNVVPILMTCAAAAVAWSQMKRHSELAQSYSLVAQEFEELETRASGITQECDFRQFVDDVEYAISREHTLWCVRREVIVPDTTKDNQRG